MISSEEHVFPLNVAIRRYPSLPSALELRRSGAAPWCSRRQRLVFFQSAAFLFVTALRARERRRGHVLCTKLCCVFASPTSCCAAAAFAARRADGRKKADNKLAAK